MATQKVNTLELNGDEYARDEAWRILVDYAGLYGDNGGDPDGNAWFPSEPLDKSDNGVSEVIKAGHGELTKVCYYENDFAAISENLSIRKMTTPEELAAQDESDEVKFEHVVDALEMSGLRFAAYGISDTFVIEW